jgi:hypothetical protein
MSANQPRKEGLIECISAMKDGTRLAQSLTWQDIEKIEIFIDFSSPRKAVSGTSKKRDSASDSAPFFGTFLLRRGV